MTQRGQFRMAFDTADVRLSDLEPRFVCQGCGGRGAEVRPDFERGNPQLAIMGKQNRR
jgi:hypothetical protein